MASPVGREPEYLLWPEHVPVVKLFASCLSQWRVAVGLGGSSVLGLDYAAVESVLRMTATPAESWPALLADLQTMEWAVLTEVSRRQQ